MPDEQEYTQLRTELALLRQAHATFVERYEREQKADKDHIKDLEFRLSMYEKIMDKGKTVAYALLGLIGVMTSVFVLRKELVDFFSKGHQ